MSTPRPILATVAALCLLQGCMTPPSAASRAMKMEPLLQVQNAGSHTAASYYQLGKFHQERGNKEAARTAYVQSIGLERRQIEARNALAVLHAEEGWLDDAKSMLTQLVQDYPKVAYLHNNLAYVYLLRGEPDAAIPAIKKALALEPGSARALSNLGLVQTALTEKRTRLVAALGLEDVIVGRTEISADPARLKALVAFPTSAVEAGQIPLRVPAAIPTAVVGPIMPEPQSPQSRMEVVQLLPNVVELRRRQVVPTILGERRQDKTEAKGDVVGSRVEVKEFDGGLVETKSLVMASPPQRPFRFGVANGNGIAGTALKMRDVLAQRGIVTMRVTNRKPFNTTTTEIFYLAGYQKEAERVKSAMAVNVTLTPTASIAGMQDVQLVLGKDMARNTAPTDKATLVAYQETNN